MIRPGSSYTILNGMPLAIFSQQSQGITSFIQRISSSHNRSRISATSILFHLQPRFVFLIMTNFFIPCHISCCAMRIIDFHLWIDDKCRFLIRTTWSIRIIWIRLRFYMLIFLSDRNTYQSTIGKGSLLFSITTS